MGSVWNYFHTTGSMFTGTFGGAVFRLWFKAEFEGAPAVSAVQVNLEKLMRSMSFRFQLGFACLISFLEVAFFR